MRTTTTLAIAGFLAGFVVTMWAMTQGAAEPKLPVVGPAGTLYPIEMMKNTKDLPVQEIFDFI